MPRLLAILLLTLIASPCSAEDSAAQTLSPQDEAAACNPGADVPVNLTPVFETPTYNFSEDLTAIQARAHDVAHMVHGSHGDLTLGLTSYEPMLHIDLPIKGVKFPNGVSCVHVDHANIVFGYKNVVVYIPHEVPQGSCGFTEIMAHEQKHIDVNRGILNEYAPIIAQYLQAYLRMNNFYRGTDPDAAIASLNQGLHEKVQELASGMIAENTRRQQLVDSPAEYRRISLSCNGELSRTANKYRSGR